MWARVKELFEARDDLDQVGLSRAIGMERSYIQNAFNRQPKPSYEVIESIASALDTTPSFLIDGTSSTLREAIIERVRTADESDLERVQAALNLALKD